MKSMYAIGPRRSTNWRLQYTEWELLNPDINSYPKFDYFHNNWGFRSIDEENYVLNDENDIWCFGCSFTVGIGVPVLNTWPAVIRKLTNYRKVKNFGVQGCGIQTIYRLMNSWYNAVDVKPKEIFVLGAFEGRSEVWCDTSETYFLQQPNMFWDKPYDIEEVERTYKDLIPKVDSFKNITTRIDIQSLVRETLDNKTYGKSRDSSEQVEKKFNVYGHPGKDFHKYTANKFLELAKT